MQPPIFIDDSLQLHSNSRRLALKKKNKKNLILACTVTPAPEKKNKTATTTVGRVVGMLNKKVLCQQRLIRRADLPDSSYQL